MARSLMPSILLVAVVAVIAGAYAINRGLYVGSERMVRQYPADPKTVFLVKVCRYLFITGVSERDALGSDLRIAPSPESDRDGFLAATKLPDDSYCHLLAD